jgi:hypothetical protein
MSEEFVELTVCKKVLMHTTIRVPEGLDDADVIEAAWDQPWEEGEVMEVWVE